MPALWPHGPSSGSTVAQNSCRAACVASCALKTLIRAACVVSCALKTLIRAACVVSCALKTVIRAACVASCALKTVITAACVASCALKTVIRTACVASCALKTVIRAACVNRSNTYVLFDIQVTVHHDKFLIIKPTRCTKFSNLFWNETLHVSDSSSVHHQEFFTVHTAMVYVTEVCWQPASRIRMELVENQYDVYHCCV